MKENEFWKFPKIFIYWYYIFVFICFFCFCVNGFWKTIKYSLLVLGREQYQAVNLIDELHYFDQMGMKMFSLDEATATMKNTWKWGFSKYKRVCSILVKSCWYCDTDYDFQLMFIGM